MKVRLSVVIPVYNRRVELKRALISLCGQSSKEFEVIVCDDGSKDDIQSLVRYFCNKLDINYIRIKNSGGPARPRNVAIGAAKYDWISFLDSDDWWKRNRVEEVAKVISSNINYDVFYHKLKTVGMNRNRSLWTNKYLGSKISEDHFSHLMTRGNCLPNSAVVLRRDSYYKVGRISEGKEYIAIEDFDYWLRLALDGNKFYFINNCLGYYWLGDDSISLDSEMVERYVSVFSSNMHLVKDEEKDAARSFLQSQIAALYWKAGNRIEAYRLLKESTHLRSYHAKFKRIVKMVAIKYNFK